VKNRHCAHNPIGAPSRWRLPFLGSARRRDLFPKIFEETRAKYDFMVAGYVVMPEHFHLLISEPKSRTITPSLVMQVLKQRVSRMCRKKAKARKQMGFWQSQSGRSGSLAAALLRFQCLYQAQARGEAAVYASQSGETKTGRVSGTVALE
jgi:REP element-mobilizing transposase RayT